MISRDLAKEVRHYINNGGVMYPGACRVGSYLIASLQLDKIVTRKEPHG